MSSSTSSNKSTLSELASRVEAGPERSGDELPIIGQADELTRRSQNRLAELVSIARSRGVSWQAIGTELDISRQAAFKRFGSGAGETTTEESTDLLARTVEVFTQLDADDYEAVRAHMTYACGRALTRRRLMSVWHQIRDDSGRLEECVDVTARTPDGSTTLSRFANRHLSTGAIVQTTLRHETGEWIGRVAYNGSGKITGIVIAPPDARNLPF